MRSKHYRNHFLLFTFGLLLALAFAYARNAAAAEPCLQGKSQVWRSGDPLGEWTYRVLLHWETGGEEGPEEFFLLLGLEGCGCACERFQAGLPDTVGFSLSETGISTGNNADLYVHYRAEYSCDGFAGTPAVPALRIVPYPDLNGPGRSGTAEILFHANWAPAGSGDPSAEALLMATPEGVCAGTLDGFLPECRCVNRVERESWSKTKRRFR